MFKIPTNEGRVDRLLRVLVAAALLALGYYLGAGVLQIVLYVAAAIALITAVIGFCGLYSLLKINTCNVNPKK